MQSCVITWNGNSRQFDIMKNKPTHAVGEDYKLDATQVKYLLERKKQKGRGKQIKGRSEEKKRNANDPYVDSLLVFVKNSLFDNTQITHSHLDSGQNPRFYQYKTDFPCIST